MQPPPERVLHSHSQRKKNSQMNTPPFSLPLIMRTIMQTMMHHALTKPSQSHFPSTYSIKYAPCTPQNSTPTHASPPNQTPLASTLCLRPLCTSTRELRPREPPPINATPPALCLPPIMSRPEACGLRKRRRSTSLAHLPPIIHMQDELPAAAPTPTKTPSPPLSCPLYAHAKKLHHHSEYHSDPTPTVYTETHSKKAAPHANPATERPPSFSSHIPIFHANHTQQVRRTRHRRAPHKASPVSTPATDAQAGQNWVSRGRYKGRQGV